MAKISLCMIVKNEEKVLSRCLDSVSDVFDEIIIIDTGSSDGTTEIAKRYTQNVYRFAWCDDFSLARNYAIKKATCEYICWLDADDVMPNTTKQFIIDNKSNFSADVYMLKYDVAFSENKATFSYYRERIIKNCSKCKFCGCVHECITPFGKVAYLDYSIEHRKLEVKSSDRNYKIYKKTLKKRNLSARELYYYSRELFDHKKYKQCLTYLKKFINTKQGWVENVIDAYYLMSLCYLKIGNKTKQFECLCKTFEFDKPRANICCNLGDYFLSENKYEIASYWYNQALNCENILKKGGFVQSFYYNYYPYLQLCICSYNLQDIKMANYYNEKAGEIKNSEAVKNNRKFFKKLIKK